MQVKWLLHLLADRGIHLASITSATITTSTRNSDLLLIVDGHRADDNGKAFGLFDKERQGVVATERHVVPIGGMVFDP